MTGTGGRQARDRAHGRRAITVLVAVALLGALVPTASATATGDATTESGAEAIEIRPGVAQLAVLGAPVGATVTVRDASGAVIPMAADGAGGRPWSVGARTTVDELGSWLARDLTPGEHTVEIDAGDGAPFVSGPVTVLDPDDTPPPEFYASRTLHERFGYIEMRDGTTLAATVSLPGPPEDGPYPTVIEYSGYSPANPNSPQPSTLLAQVLGYATVGVNIRGTGCSGGSFFYFEPLQALDAYDVIETVAAQPWVAHGHVGMVGISYPGISQLFAARTQPPGLGAIAPLSVYADTYRSILSPGGIPNDGFARNWARERDEQGAPFGQGWTRQIVDAGGPLGEECERNQRLSLQNPNLVEITETEEFYEAERGDPLSPVTFADRFEVPVFMAGAWQDEQTGGHFPWMWDRLSSAPFTRLTATNGTHIESLLADNLNRWFEFLEFHVARRIPVAPPLFRIATPLVIESETGASGIQLEADRFTGYESYAQALAAYEAEDPVRIIVENGAADPDQPGAPGGTFELSFTQWPPAEMVPTPFHLGPDGSLGTGAPTIGDDDARAATEYRYDPDAQAPRTFLGSTGAIWRTLPNWRWDPLPLGAALAFDTDPLETDLVAVGHGSVDLWIRSSAPDTDLEVNLTEIRPDGQEVYVQSGWLRASRRALDPGRSEATRPWHTHLPADAAPLPAGEFSPVRIELFPFAHAFRAGSRLRLTVEAPGGNRPFWTFDALAADGAVTNEVAHSVGRPSRLVLPVIPDVDVPAGLPACPSLRGQPCRPAFGSSRPTAVTASVTGAGAEASVDVRWSAPDTIRPDDELTGYRVTARPTATTQTVDADATSAIFDGLDPGHYAFTVEALFTGDATSGPSTPSSGVTVPPPPPPEPARTTVTDGPGPVTTDRFATFSFVTEPPGAATTCALGSALAAACSSPVTVGPLDPGYHVFRVAAAGEHEPAARLFFVDDSPTTCAGWFGFLRPACWSSVVQREVAAVIVPLLQAYLDDRRAPVAVG